MLVAEYVAKFIKKQKINDLFMLTGYGAMYLNDAIAKEKINYYAKQSKYLLGKFKLFRIEYFSFKFYF